MFEGSETTAALVEAVRAFCLEHVAPTAEHDDANEHFRKDLVAAMGEQGFCGVATPEAYGGLGLGYVEYCALLEEVAKFSASYAVTIAVTGLPQVILNTFGSEAQKAEWLPGLASGALLGAFALSEPGSGSDAASLRTTAEKVEGGYVLRGTKYWITHGSYADVYVVMARTGPAKAAGISAFLVRGDAAGLSFGRKEKKMGMRASPTVEVTLDGVFVPDADRIGPEGIGFTVAMVALDSGRITIAASAVGLAQASLDYSAKYATERKQFDQAIIDFQGVGFMLADMAMGIEASRLLVQKAAWLKDHGQPFSTVAAMAKCTATDTAMRVTTDAVQVLGGYGYCSDHPVERYMRDAKVMQIVEGTNQVQRLVISRAIKKAAIG
jgi:alkylation response protein AidB-like acyl-CoA dehydrogenase